MSLPHLAKFSALTTATFRFLNARAVVNPLAAARSPPDTRIWCKTPNRPTPPPPEAEKKAYATRAVSVVYIPALHHRASLTFTV